MIKLFDRIELDFYKYTLYRKRQSSLLQAEVLSLPRVRLHSGARALSITLCLCVGIIGHLLQWYIALAQTVTVNIALADKRTTKT